jgi:Ras-related protein Rab-5C
MRTAAGSSATRSEKIALIGAASTGKTSIVNRFVHDKFNMGSEATIGAAFISKTITVDQTDLKLEIWDTGGTEKYKSLAPLYFRDARAAIIVFDVTSEQSFEEAGNWLSAFRERGPPSAIVVCAANKIDLEGERKVTLGAATDFGFQNQLEFVRETSAMTGVGVKELFTDLAKQLLALPPLNGCDIHVTDEPPRVKREKCNC